MNVRWDAELAVGKLRRTTVKNIEKLGCVAFIALVMGMSIESVGQKQDHPGDTWSIVWIMFVFMAIPTALAYLAGRKDGRDS